MRLAVVCLSAWVALACSGSTPAPPEPIKPGTAVPLDLVAAAARYDLTLTYEKGVARGSFEMSVQRDRPGERLVTLKVLDMIPERWDPALLGIVGFVYRWRLGRNGVLATAGPEVHAKAQKDAVAAGTALWPLLVGVVPILPEGPAAQGQRWHHESSWDMLVDDVERTTEATSDWTLARFTESSPRTAILEATMQTTIRDRAGDAPDAGVGDAGVEAAPESQPVLQTVKVVVYLNLEDSQIDFASVSQGGRLWEARRVPPKP